MEFFDIIHLHRDESHIYERIGKKEKLFVGKGSCRVKTPEGAVTVSEDMSVDLYVPKGHFEVFEVFSDTTLIRLCGRWGETTGSCGTFAMDNSMSSQNTGDAVDYPRNTEFDNHYHDCDEYWIIFEGQCVAVSEKKVYILDAGDCLVTGMGHHHDLPQIIEPIKGVYFETTLEGKKRLGHLWNHTHGPAEPKADRV